MFSIKITCVNFGTPFITPTEEKGDNFNPGGCPVDDVGRKVDLSYKKKAVKFGINGKRVFDRFPLYRKTFERLNPCDSYIGGLRVSRRVEQMQNNLHLLRNMYYKSLKKLVPGHLLSIT